MKQIMILLLLTMLMSCQKEEDKATGVNGRVLEYGTNKPLEGIATILKVRGTPDGINTTDTAFTDKEGRFSVRVEEIGTIVDLTTQADGYYPFPGQYLIPPQRVTTYPADIILDPKAYINFRFLNDTGLFYEMKYNVACGNEPFPNFYFGEFFDIYKLIQCKANRESKIYWETTFNGVTTNYIDSLYIPAFDTLDYTIKM